MSLSLALPDNRSTLFNALLQEIATSISDIPEEGAPDNWHDWAKFFFPLHANKPFAEHHEKMWEWAWKLRQGVRARPLVAILARGGAKSTTAEMITAMVGARRSRKYVIYVRNSQDQADGSVSNIAALLESTIFSDYYPSASKPAIGKFGTAKGWRRNRLRAANGFTVDALGLDTSLRGIRVDNMRPDLIILDDIDQEHDLMPTTKRKTDTITKGILPTGSGDVAILAVQNLIISHGFFANMVNGNADYMKNRIMIGPVPAVRDLEYTQEENDEGRLEFRVTGGVPTWEGQALDVVEAQMNEWGLIPFRVEAQHEVDIQLNGTYSGVVFQYCDLTECPPFDTVACWVDPAVSDKDNSDAMGIQIDGLESRKHAGKRRQRIYRLFSFEGRSTSERVLRHAIEKAYQFGASTIGIETDQGGDLWHAMYKTILEKMQDEGVIPEDYYPRYKAAKAGAIGSKRHRHNMMRAAYDEGQFWHVRGTSLLLEQGLARFPEKKPFDLADAAFWSWWDLKKSRGWTRGPSE